MNVVLQSFLILWGRFPRTFPDNVYLNKFEIKARQYKLDLIHVIHTTTEMCTRSPSCINRLHVIPILYTEDNRYDLFTLDKIAIGKIYMCLLYVSPHIHSFIMEIHRMKLKFGKAASLPQKQRSQQVFFTRMLVSS